MDQGFVRGAQPTVCEYILNYAKFAATQHFYRQPPSTGPSRVHVPVATDLAKPRPQLVERAQAETDLRSS